MPNVSFLKHAFLKYRNWFDIFGFLCYENAVTCILLTHYLKCKIQHLDNAVFDAFCKHKVGITFKKKRSKSTFKHMIKLPDLRDEKECTR